MKVLYIASEFGMSNGTNTNLMIHYSAIISCVGKENVFTVDLNSGGKQILTNSYLAYNYPTNKLDKLFRLLQGYTVLMSNKICRDICRVISEQNIDIVFIDESIYGRLVKKIKSRYPRIKVITFYHDVKRNLYSKWLKQYGVSFLKQYIPGVMNEKLNVKYSDINITLNKRESGLFQHYYNKTADAELPVGIKSIGDPEKQNTKMTDEIQILFVGAKYYPNQYGIQWFCENVFPFINPRYVLTIVGRGMECMRDTLESERVHVVGGTESLTPFYNNSDIVIAPIFEGAGMKVKTAEALAYGKMFLGTHESLVGYNEALPQACEDFILECNTKEEYIDALEKIEKSNLKKWHKEVADYFEINFSESAIAQKLVPLLEIEKTEQGEKI